MSMKQGVKYVWCMQQGTPLPPATELGDSSVHGSMAGSFLAPDLHVRWEAPAASASGTANFSRDANRFTCRAPSLDVSGALFLRPAPFDAVKAVLTQARPLDSQQKINFHSFRGKGAGVNAVWEAVQLPRAFDVFL